MLGKLTSTYDREMVSGLLAHCGRVVGKGSRGGYEQGKGGTGDLEQPLNCLCFDHATS